jgi:hypothetical protein
MKFLIRILIGILSFIFVIKGFWQGALLLLAIGLFLFPFYVEIIIFGYIFDNLFGSSSLGFIYNHLGFLISLSIYILYSILNSILRK